MYTAEAFQLNHYSGTPVVGARVIVENHAGQILGSAFVEGGNGHSGHRPSEVHFGLGQTPPTEALTLHIQWRTSRDNIHRDVIDGTVKRWNADGWTTMAAPVFASSPRDTPSSREVGAGWWVAVVGDD